MMVDRICARVAVQNLEIGASMARASLLKGILQNVNGLRTHLSFPEWKVGKHVKHISYCEDMVFSLGDP